MGLWQVRTLKAETGKGTTRDINKLLADPNFQARSAWEISGGGRNYRPWSVYTSGAYSKNMSTVQGQMQAKGIGDPVPDAAMQLKIVAPPAAGGGGGGGTTINIANASFTAQIARGTPEEAERFARFVMATLSDRNRILQIQGGSG